MTTAIPTDDAALDAIDHALAAALTYEAEDGSPLPEPRVVGAEYQLDQLLDFWSGADPDDGVLEGYTPDGQPVYVSEQVRLSERDVIRALIAEVRRLRNSLTTAQEDR